MIPENSIAPPDPVTINRAASVMSPLSVTAEPVCVIVADPLAEPMVIGSAIVPGPGRLISKVVPSSKVVPLAADPSAAASVTVSLPAEIVVRPA